MGASHAFDASKADFSNITSNREPFFISKVIHKAVVEVNEVGTEAAAATVIKMLGCAPGQPEIPIEFKCNRPFLFMIHDNRHNNILFFGKVVNPTLN